MSRMRRFLHTWLKPWKRSKRALNKLRRMGMVPNPNRKEGYDKTAKSGCGNVEAVQPEIQNPLEQDCSNPRASGQ